MFYLLLYGFLDNTIISLRGLEDIYNSQKFKFLFNIDQQNTIKYNSLSDRLTALNPEFLKKVYEYVYGKFSEVFNSSEAEKYSIIRVDSTLVKEVTNKLQRGITMGNQHNKAKHVKFTVATGATQAWFSGDCERFEHSRATPWGWMWLIYLSHD